MQNLLIPGVMVLIDKIIWPSVADRRPPVTHHSVSIDGAATGHQGQNVRR